MSSTQNMPVQKPVSRVRIPHAEWEGFLEFFSTTHRRATVWLETYDKETDETVLSRSRALLGVELDLEEERHPRINITLQSDNKVFKHILYLPSRLVVYGTSDGVTVGLRVESVNTSTTLWLRL
jgi:hypothetical protein